MVISPTYGQVSTPSEANSNFSDVVAALPAPYQTPANSNSPSAHSIAIQTFMKSNGAAAPGIGGTYATNHALRMNQPL